ncbi:MAG: 4-deoxy-4-formamido-L-arabinose-phosphoundecaprenol deformylase [Caldimonas sp.]
MRRIALKVDADTWRGTRDGVPALARLFERLGIPATFLFSLGPDQTGRALGRAFRPGFLGKVRRTSVVRHYGIRTLLYGTLLPAPDIGRREGATMRAVAAAGFDTGIHVWNHTLWQDNVATASAGWTKHQMRLAADRYADIFGRRPTIHGAAGWQMNEVAFRFESELGIQVASDTRGSSPFVPVDRDGHESGPTQFPTTLPTMDELIGIDGCEERNVHEHLLALTETRADLQVFTLHAELEGIPLIGSLQKLVSGWRVQGWTFVSLSQLPELFRGVALPRCVPRAGTVSGRSGLLSTQGPAI